MLKFFLSVFLLFFFIPGSFALPLRVRYFQKDHRYEFRIALLKLALEKALGPNNFKLIPSAANFTYNRGIALLEKKELDILSKSENSILNKRLLPIKIPILRGILGYRLFLINKKKLPLFQSIKNYKELKEKTVVGSGAHWGDRKILEKNGLLVETTPQYQALFKMLNYNRFDYFPRGINEIFNEMEEFGPKYKNIMIDPSLAFFYVYPVYFYVHKSNQKLANIVEKGLRLAEKDGSYKSLFLKYHSDVFKKFEITKTKVFFLKNHLIEKPSIPIDTSWWLPKEVKFLSID